MRVTWTGSEAPVLRFKSYLLYDLGVLIFLTVYKLGMIIIW